MPFDPSTAKPVKSGFDPATAKPVGEQQAPAEGYDFSFMEMMKNVPGSAATLGKNIWDAVSSPVQTGEAVANLVGGASQAMNQGIQESDWAPDWLKAISFTPVDAMTDEDLTPYADAFVQGVKDRYGSVDNAKRTLEQDPVGAMADIASVVTPLLPKGGAALNPINAGKNLVRGAVKVATPKRLPVKIYERVAKFGTTLDDQQRAAMINTALKYGLTPSEAGVTKLAGIIQKFNSKLDDLIATNKGAIPRQAIYKHINELRREVGGFKFEAADDLQAVDRMIKNFEVHAGATLPKSVSARELQAFKTDLYKRINFDARHLQGTPISEQVRKTVARGAKEGIEQLEPGVKGVNSTLADLYELQPHLQRAANRIGNRRTIPLTAPMEVGAGAGAGYALGGEVGAGIGTALGTGSAVLAHPKVAPSVAIGLQRLKDKRAIDILLQNNPNLSAAELALILSGRATEENPQPEQ